MTTAQTQMSGSIEWTYTTTTREIRQNAKCKCGRAHSRIIVQTTKSTYRSDKIGTAGRPIVRRAGEVAVDCECGRHVCFLDVKGTINHEIECDERCMSATGCQCECSCGGKNHGVSHGN